MPSLSIKTKLCGMVVSLLLLFVGFLVLYQPWKIQRLLAAHGEVQGQEVAHRLARALAPALAQGNREMLRLQLQGLGDTPGFQFAGVWDETGRLLEGTPGLPMDAGNGPGTPASALHQTWVDLPFQRQGHAQTGRLWVAFAVHPEEAVLRQHFREGLWAGGAVLLLGLLSSCFLANAYIRPLRRLTDTARGVAQGQFENLEHSQVRSGDELEDLSRSFEAMTEKLRANQEELERHNRLLEFRVQERTRQLMETIWELEETRAHLEDLVQERTRGLEESQRELEIWARTLEEKVQEKTRDLSALNQSLQASYAQLQAADRLKDTFLGNVSHELRTPLNAIVGFSGLLLQQPPQELSPDLREDIGVILENGRMLQRMIDSILDFSRLDSDHFSLDLRVMDVLPLLREQQALAHALILDRPIRFSMDVPVGEATVKADPGRLRQVLQILLANAIQFTERGEVRLDVAPQKDHLQIVLRDTGQGMSAESLDQLFHPFRHGEAASRSLSFSLAKRLVELMGGSIEAESVLQQGSTFIVRLPFLPGGSRP